ncbi:MAG: 23S rRNA (guanosine(2251)-2'-O)-methyltransferase RlmB [Thiotrichales bacterium]|nr:23S rRNA (guanosine(2251)-2'-O)-methyltransferase RlmB [Thiotrichales bacterium]
MTAKDKRKQNLYYGVHSVHHALSHAAGDVLELWIANSKKTSPDIQLILRLAESNGIRVQRIPPDSLDNMTGTRAHQGVAIRRRPPRILHEDDLHALLTRDGTQLYLILDGVQDPHNLGACLRSADAAGAAAVIAPKDNAAGLNATVCKVASGAAESVPFITVTNLARTMRDMRDHSVWMIGTDDSADQDLFAANLAGNIAIVMGAEGRGLRQNTRKHCDEVVRLPMHGSVASLNVSVAAGICLYEVLRQRDRQ